MVELERALPHAARDKRTGNHTMVLTIPNSRLTATMCKSVAQFSKDLVRIDSYLLCTFRWVDCGCPRADTLRSAPCDCGGNCWDALGCAFHMHGAPEFGCKGGNNLTADTVEQNSRSGICFCNTTGTSVVQSMSHTSGDSTVFCTKLKHRHLSLPHIWYVGGSINELHLRGLHSFLCLEIEAPVVASRQMRPTHDQRTEPVALHRLLYRSDGASADVKGSPGRKSSSCRTTQVLSCFVPNWQTINTLTS